MDSALRILAILQAAAGVGVLLGVGVLAPGDDTQVRLALLGLVPVWVALCLLGLRVARHVAYSAARSDT